MSVEPVGERGLVDAQMRGPIRHAHRLSVMRNHVGNAGVSRLHHEADPPAILGRIVPVVVDAVKGQSGTDQVDVVGNEIRGIVPPLANPNAAPSVSGVARVFRVGAPLHHRRPSVVNRRIGLAVGGVGLNRSFLVQTPARLALTRSDPGAREGSQRPASAAAIIENGATRSPLFRLGENGPAKEGFANDFQCFAHGAKHSMLPNVDLAK
jgi:hypothetical protein